jgi:predicted dehydrogenase
LAAGRLDFDAITSDVVPFDDAVATYEKLNRGELQGLGVVFSYPLQGSAVEPLARPQPSSIPRLRLSASPADRVRLGVIGCGNYATTMLLPHLKGRPDVELVEVTTATSLSAINARTRFGFARVSTDFHNLLADPEINAVLIATRHDSHAHIACEALRAGKAVFVEKPLAVTAEQLAAIQDAIAETGNDRLMVGFNRRYARLLNGLRDAWGGCGGPQVLDYTVNAGPLEAGSWYGQAESQGTRFLGDGGHFIDTVSWWLGADPLTVQAATTPRTPDNIIALLSYPDGSVAKVAYVTDGDPSYPREVLEVFGDGKVARMENFTRAELWRGGRCRTTRAATMDKGQKRQLEAFIQAVRTGADMPVALDSLVATTASTLAVGRSITHGKVEAVAAWDRAADQGTEDEGCLEMRAAQ